MTKTESLCTFRSYHDNELGVDRKDGMIRGAKVIQAGGVNDYRPIVVDADSLAQVVELGNMPNRGIKARWTHPDGESLGSHLGRWSNFRVDGDSVRADLKLAESSKHSPIGNIYDYTMTLAEEDPEAFGVSIAFYMDAEMMSERNADGDYPLRLESLYSCDVVGEPAATRGGLFSIEEKEMSDTKTELETQQEIEVQEEVVISHDKHVELFGDRGARWFLEGKPLEECLELRMRELEGELVEAESLLQIALAKGEELARRIESFQALITESVPVQHAIEVPDGDRKEEASRVAREQRLAEAKRRGVSEKDFRWASAFSG